MTPAEEAAAREQQAMAARQAAMSNPQPAPAPAVAPAAPAPVRTALPISQLSANHAASQLSGSGLTATGSSGSAINQIMDLQLAAQAGTTGYRDSGGYTVAQRPTAPVAGAPTTFAPQPFAPQPFAPQAAPVGTPGVVMNQRAARPDNTIADVTDDHRTTAFGDSAEVSHQNRAYNLGGDPYFVEGASLATQSAANRGSVKVQGQGDAAMNLGVRADMDMRQQAQNATLYGNTAATNGTALASGLTNAGGRLETGANAAQTRAAPLADATAQNSMLGQASTSLQGQAATANALGTQAGSLAQQGTAAGSRVAPTQNTTAQNAALWQASSTLQDQSGTASSLGQQAGQLAATAASTTGRQAPLLQTGAQNAALGQAATGASALNTSARQATDAGTMAGYRNAPNLDYSPANATLRQAAGNVGTLTQAGEDALRASTSVQNRVGTTLEAGAQNRALLTSEATGQRLGGAADQLMRIGTQAGARQGISADYGQSRSELGQLTGLEAQQGPSGAQALLNQGAAQSMAQSLAMARSGRGFGGNAQNTAEALRTNAATMQGVSNQSAMLRAQEDAAWRGRQAQNLTTSAGLRSNQASQEQAAALQARSMNDQAQASMFGLGSDAMKAQGAMQQAGAAQYGQQAVTQAQLTAQQRAMNDQQQQALLGIGTGATAQAAGLRQQTAAQQAAQTTQAAATQQQQTALNDSAMSQLMGLGMQGQQAAIGAQQANAAQYGQQSQFQAAAAQQQTAMNDQARAQLLGLSQQGLTAQSQAQAQIAAGQQANAAQMGQQSQFNVQSAQQQTALNDAARAQLMGLSQQGLTAQGQLQGQTAAGLQASAGQYGQQSQFQAQQQLASRQANDAYSAQLTGQALQARQAGLAGNLDASRLGLQGQELGGNLYGQGVEAGFKGTTLGMQGAQIGTGMQQEGLTNTFKFAEADRQAQLDAEESTLQKMGIREGVAIQRRAQDQALLGSALSAGGTILAGAALMSDKRAKTGIRRASKEELMLSPGDSLLAPKEPPKASALDEISALETEQKYAMGGPMVSPSGGRGVVGPGGPVYDKAIGQAVAAERLEAQKAAASRQQGASMIAGGLQGLGSGMQNRTELDTYDRYTRRRPREQSQMVMSDETTKTDLRKAEGYSYKYKDPKRHGEGQHVGPMAQDLQKTSAKDAVVKQPNGKLAVDTGRLTLRNTAAISQQQRDLDDLMAELESLKSPAPREGVAFNRAARSRL